MKNIGATEDLCADLALTVRILRLHRDFSLPTPALPGDAGLDLRARQAGVLAPAGGRAVVPVGIALALPVGFAGLVLPRSGLAARHGVTVVNAPGLIDSGYRGEVMVVLLNTDPHEAFSFEPGDRIAQLTIVRVPEVVWEEVEDLAELGETDRGSGGHGHSGRS